MQTAEKLKSLSKKMTSSALESKHFQISNNHELLFVLAPTSLEQIKYPDYSQFENVHFLTVGQNVKRNMYRRNIAFLKPLLQHFGY